MARIMPLCAVYDNLIGYKNVHLVANLPVAERAFTNSLVLMLESGDCGDASPADLSLYHIGDFDMDTGEIIPCEPTSVVHGTTIIPKWHNGDFYYIHNNKASKGEMKDD